MSRGHRKRYKFPFPRARPKRRSFNVIIFYSPRSRDVIKTRARVCVCACVFLQMEEKSRTVEECCEGYRMLMIHGTAETNARCLPFCERCLTGACVAPNECKCNPGYRGEDCSLGEFKVDLPFVNASSSRRSVYSANSAFRIGDVFD